MCEFISGVLTLSRVYFLMDSDSHSDIRDFYKIPDDPQESINLELLPRDKGIFNHDPNNWILCIDQSDLPEWFTTSVREFARQEMLACLAQRVKQRFHIDLVQRVTISDGVHYLLNSIATVTNNATVYAYGHSSVSAFDKSRVIASDSTLVMEAKDFAQVELFDIAFCCEATERTIIIAKDFSSAKVYSLDAKVSVADYAVVRVYVQPSEVFTPIDYRNYMLNSNFRPILDFVYQQELFIKAEQLSFRKKIPY